MELDFDLPDELSDDRNNMESVSQNKEKAPTAPPMSLFRKLFQIPVQAKKAMRLSEEELCSLLNTDPEALKAFEESYRGYTEKAGIPENLFAVNSRQMAELKEGVPNEVPDGLSDIMARIVDDLISQTEMYVYDGKSQSVTDYRHALPEGNGVTKEMIMSLPEDVRPQLTGNLMRTDIPGSGNVLLMEYSEYQKAKDPQRKQTFYHQFRQGLDLLDLDPVTYRIIDQNKNSMGYWLPRITEAVDMEGFFRIPATKIIKVPLTLLQLTRQDYMSLSRTTLDIVDDYCRKVFGLDPGKEYFIKTGTYSSKFDFRNARVAGEQEVRELGEYLLFIHWQALRMAHYDLSGRHQPVIYGVSTTTEWVVRDFIPDKEENLTIYHGLPLHTEYRVFVDCDTDEVLGIHPYWEADTMKQHFGGKLETDPDAMHDYITYTTNEKRLAKRYGQNKDAVAEHIRTLLPDMELSGQWSIDIMQNGDDFWLIDMALAENSAFYRETVPEHLRRPSPEQWLPDLGRQEQ